MFELVEIARNGDFYKRIFPIILPDARIHKDFERIDYLKYWEDEKAKLQAKYKQLDLVNTNSIMATLNLYDEIRSNIDNLTNILKDMKNLDINLHGQSEFAAMIEAVETKLAEDSQKLSNQSPVKSESKYTIHAKNVLHSQSEFAAMIQKVETKLAEDGQKLSNQSPVKSESKYTIHAKNVQIIEKGDGQIQDSSS